MTHAFPKSVKIVEVGPRDGLQNEAQSIPVATKVELINRLSQTGLRCIEAGSLVSPKNVPQMAGSDEVFITIDKKPDVSYPLLVPNLKGMERALPLKAKHIAFFTAASETFNQKNIRCSIDESLDRLKDIMPLAQANGIDVRGYVSCVMGCPYEGDVPIRSVVDVTKRLIELGCSEISLGDTIGVGTPGRVATLLNALLKTIPLSKLAVHFHDTYGQALANIYQALTMGIGTVDSSVAGLGGCPYAKGATGNVATEDVLYLLQGLGIQTDVNLEAVAATGYFICDALQRDNASKVAVALKNRTS